MAETDTSPAALRALAEHRRVYQDRDDTTPVSRPWLKEVRAILRVIARNIEREMHVLGNPSSVHINMLRGTIAKPTIDQIVHLYGREALLAALAAEKEAGAPAPDADGWIPWEGGECPCPVKGDVYVDVILRDGFTPKPRPARNFRWGLSDICPDGDIIAYRLSKEG